MLSSTGLYASCGAGRDTHTIDDDVVIASVADLARLDGVTRIEGSLDLASGLTGNLQLPSLAWVRDALRVQKTTLVSLALPALTHAGLVAVQDNPNLVRVELPLLLEVAPASPAEFGGFSVDGSPPSAEVRAPSLRVVNGTVSVSTVVLSLPALEQADQLHIGPTTLQLDLPRLLQLDTLHVEGAKIARAFALPALVELGTAFVDDEGLTALSLPQLVRVTGELTLLVGAPLRELDLSSLQQIGTLDVVGGEVAELTLPALRQAGGLHIEFDASIHALSLPKLEHVGLLGVESAELVSLSLPALQTLSTLELATTSLASLSLPELQIAGSFELHDNEQLTSISAPKLTQLGVIDEQRNGLSFCPLSATFPWLASADRQTHAPEPCP